PRRPLCSASLSPSSLFFFSSRRRHTRSKRDWSSDVCSSDLFSQINRHFVILLFHPFGIETKHFLHQCFLVYHEPFQHFLYQLHHKVHSLIQIPCQWMQ